MKKTYLIISVILAVIFALPVCLMNVVIENKLKVDCYLYDPCGGCFTEAGPCKPCTVENEYRNKYEKLISDNLLSDKVEINIYNILYPIYSLAYSRKLKDMNIEDNGIYPVVFIGDTYFMGDQQILDKMIPYIKSETTMFSIIARTVKNSFDHNREAEIHAVGKDKVLYFFSEYCSDCKKIDGFFKDKFEDNPDFLRNEIIKYNINKSENMLLLERIVKKYGGDAQEITVPSIIVEDKFLTGYKAIIGYFDSDRLKK